MKFRFITGSKSVRNNIIDIVRVNCKTHHFTENFCKHLREFKRHSLDNYNEIMFVLPTGEEITIITSLVDGEKLRYDIPSFDSKVHPEFQKKRWWKFSSAA